MSNLVIVAIPKENDPVWKVSSEKIPHMTLLFLGESTKDIDILEIVKFLGHASDFSLKQFWMDVEKRGTLGDDQADVLFFRKSPWNINTINNFRAALLKNDEIKKAYDNAEQFPEWNPHLTLGYPETPAKPDDRDYPGFSSVYFDKIALWTGNYEGPTFDLKEYDWTVEVSMGTVEQGVEATKDILKHYGVKGMRWGQRKTESVSVSQKGKKLKTKGGTGQPAHEDAIRKATIARTKKKSGVNAISDKDLQKYANRLELESRVKRLESQQSPARKFISNILRTSGQKASQDIGNEAGSRAAKKAISLADKKGKGG